MKQVLGKLFIIVSVMCMFYGSFLLWRRSDSRYFKLVKAQNTLAQMHSYADAMPTKITIPSISVDLPIVPSKISKGVWEVSTIGVSYIAKSPIPGDIGNSILYAHNWPTLLGNLAKVRPGDKITISYQHGKPKIFTVQFINTVSPESSSVLFPTTDRRITLYTCTGFLDSKRLIVTAVLDSYSEELSLSAR